MRIALALATAVLLVTGCASTIRQAGLAMMVRDARAGTPKEPFCFSGIFHAQGKGLVVAVAPSSERFGILPGDEIETIDGVAWFPPVRGSLADAWAGWEVSRKPGQRVRVGIERSGQKLQFEIVCEDALALYAKPLLGAAEDMVAKRWDSCLYNAGRVLMATGPNVWAQLLVQQCLTGSFNDNGMPQSMIPAIVQADMELYGTYIRQMRIGRMDLATIRPAVLQSIEGMRKLGYAGNAAELQALLDQDTLQSKLAHELKMEADRREEDKRRYSLELARLQKEKEVAIATAQEARAAAAKAEAEAARIGATKNDSDGSQAQPKVTSPKPNKRFKPGLPKTQKGATPELVGTGTCFAVDRSGGVLTSNHVVSTGDQVVVRFPGQGWIEGTVEIQDAANDLALIRLPTVLPKVLSIRPGPGARLGEQVFTIGFPVPQLLGFSPKFSEGTVASLDGPAGSPTMFQMTIPIQPGNSGGPVVGTDGGVLGVVASTAKVDAFFAASGTIPQNVNWAVKASYAAPLLTSSPDGASATGREEAISLAQDAVCQVATFRWADTTEP